VTPATAVAMARRFWLVWALPKDMPEGSEIEDTEAPIMTGTCKSVIRSSGHAVTGLCHALNRSSRDAGLFFLDLSMVDRRLHDDLRLRKIYSHLKAP
jgi:hypothetical protein